MNKKVLFMGAGLSLLAGTTLAAECPPITVADAMGVGAGKHPQQYELAEFEQLAGCALTFQENPAIAEMNGRIAGNPDLPPLAERLPEEPLVMPPYAQIGRYGGVLDVLSNATEAGTSDFLSVRHVNLVRMSDDLQTIVPNVAKDWQWNDDFTELTFTLRKGHKWSDGAPFTADDVKFWYDDLALDPNVSAKPRDYVLVAGERMQVEVIDPQTVKFVLPAPKPGLLSHFATSYAQGFQPKHFLGQFHPKHNPDADKLAQELGFENGYAVIAAYFGNSDWTDTPTPMLAHPDKVDGMPKATLPTLESHIYTKDTTEGRHLVANPYFHVVDTAGNQLPYITEQDEVYINENEVRILKLVNAEVDYKSQSVRLPSAPMLLDGQEKGNYTIDLRPTIAMETFSFNLTSEDLEKRKVFGDLRFRQAMSVAINRDEINEVAFFGLGQPKQYTGFSPEPDFITDEWKQHYAQYDSDLARKLLDEVGLADTDGDGFRELPNGDKLVLHIQFATQGASGKVVELVGQHWSDVGVQTTYKEVTPGRVPLGAVLQPARCRRMAQGPAARDDPRPQRELRRAVRRLLQPPHGDAVGRAPGDRRSQGRAAAGLGLPDDRRHQRVPVHPGRHPRVGGARGAPGRKPDRQHDHDRHGARTEPDLPPERTQELRRLQDMVVRVLPDLSLPCVPVVPGRRELSVAGPTWLDA